MSCSLKKFLILLLFQALAFWRVGVWYAQRVLGSEDQGYCLVAILAAGALLFVKRRNAPPAGAVNLLLPTVMVLFYATVYSWVTPTIRAAIAFVSLSCTITQYVTGRAFHPGLCGLFLLSLPILPSLQFFVGYPLRVVVATLAAPLLQLAGFGVVRRGAILEWRGEELLIDAPCSGLSMIWSGMFLTFILIALYPLNLHRTLFVCALAAIMLVLGNALRVASLFYIETGQMKPFPLLHDMVGLAVFAFTACGVAWMIQRIARKSICEQFST